MTPEAEVLLEAAEVLRERLVTLAEAIIHFRGEWSEARMASEARDATRLHRGWCALHAQAVAILEADS